MTLLWRAKAWAVGADLDGRAGELKGQKGASGASEGGVNWHGAESAEPVSAEELAAERPLGVVMARRLAYGPCL